MHRTDDNKDEEVIVESDCDPKEQPQSANHCEEDDIKEEQHEEEVAVVVELPDIPDLDHEKPNSKKSQQQRRRRSSKGGGVNLESTADENDNDNDTTKPKSRRRRSLKGGGSRLDTSLDQKKEEAEDAKPKMRRRRPSKWNDSEHTTGGSSTDPMDDDDNKEGTGKPRRRRSSKSGSKALDLDDKDYDNENALKPRRRRSSKGASKSLSDSGEDGVENKPRRRRSSRGAGLRERQDSKRSLGSKRSLRSDIEIDDNDGGVDIFQNFSDARPSDYVRWNFGKTCRVNIQDNDTNQQAAITVQRMIRGWWARLQYRVQRLEAQLIAQGKSLDDVYRTMNNTVNDKSSSSKRSRRNKKAKKRSKKETSKSGRLKLKKLPKKPKSSSSRRGGKRKDKQIGSSSNDITNNNNAQSKKDPARLNNNAAMRRREQESKKLISYLRKKNKKLRGKNEKIRGAILGLQEQNERLDGLADQADGSLEFLLSRAKEIKATNDHLLQIEPVHKENVLQVHKQVEEQHELYELELKIKNNYIEKMESIFELLKNSVPDQPDLIHEVAHALVGTLQEVEQKVEEEEQKAMDVKRQERAARMAPKRQLSLIVEGDEEEEEDSSSSSSSSSDESDSDSSDSDSDSDSDYDCYSVVSYD